MNEPAIEVIARAIITDETDSKMLFCSPKDNAYFYLPGGHVEFGETAKSALVRELFEETGADTSSAEFRFAGASENIFHQDDAPHHEMNLCFEVSGVFSGEEEVASLEEHISFQWVPIADIGELPVLPEKMKPLLSEWHSGKRIQWKNE